MNRVEFSTGRRSWPWPRHWGVPTIANLSRLSDTQVEDEVRRWACGNIVRDKRVKLELRRHPGVPGCVRGDVALMRIRARERTPWGS